MFVRARLTAALFLATTTFAAGFVSARPAFAAAGSALAGPGPEVAISADGATQAWITNGWQSQSQSAVAGSILVRDTHGIHPYGAPSGCSADAALAHTKHLVMSADGSTVVWVSDSSTFACIAHVQTAVTPGVTWVYAERAGQVMLVSRSTGGAAANGVSDWPAVSADGRQIAFSSAAKNLAAGDTNNAPDVFVRDLVANRTVRLSTATHHTGVDKTAISPDGRYVAYKTTAAVTSPAIASTALANLFVVDRKPSAQATSFDQSESTRLVAAPAVNQRTGVPIGFPSAGQLAFSGTTNVFLFNVSTGVLQNTKLSSSGLWVVTPSTITQCVDRLNNATFFWHAYTISGSTLTGAQDMRALGGNYCGSMAVSSVQTHAGMMAPKKSDGSVFATWLMTWQWQPQGTTQAANVAKLTSHL